MDKSKQEEAEGVNLYVATLSNICNCCNRQKEYYPIINFASKGLKIKEVPKLYYFRAIAYANNDEFSEAKKMSNHSKIYYQKKTAIAKKVLNLY